MKIGSLAYIRLRKVDCTRCELSWYHYDLDVGIKRCVRGSVEPGQDRQNDGSLQPSYRRL